MRLIKYIRILFLMISVHFLGIRVDKRLKNGEDLEDYIYTEVNKWAKKVNKIAGVEITVEGKENLPEGNCFFVSNHQSYFDIMTILASIEKPLGFIAKQELKTMPVAGKWMERIRCKFLNRENPREAIKTMNDAAEELNRGYSMVIFPEGTRSKGGEIAEFKKGSLKIATKAKDVPIVPLTIEGTYNALEKNGLNSAKVKLVIDKPIYIKDYSKEQLNELSKQCYDIIKSNHDKM